MRASLTRTALGLDFLTTRIPPQIYESWSCQWMTAIEMREWDFFSSYFFFFFWKARIKSGTCKYSACETATQWCLGKLLRCCNGYSLTLELGRAQIFRLFIRLCAVTSATITHVFSMLSRFKPSCAAWIGPLTWSAWGLWGLPVLSSTVWTESWGGLCYLVCTVMARPQQVGVQTQGKLGAWHLSWVKT